MYYRINKTLAGGKELFFIEENLIHAVSIGHNPLNLRTNALGSWKFR